MKAFKYVCALAIISALILVLVSCGGGGSADETESNAASPQTKLPQNPPITRRI